MRTMLMLNRIMNYIREYRNKKLAKCGIDVHMPRSCSIVGKAYCGNHIWFGVNNILLCTGAPIEIGDHVMFGPNVTMITGDHRIDIPGKYMTEIKGEDKLPENDIPIILKGDNWIGANATILKGVTIGIGAVVAAGAVVIKDVPPYSVVGGVSARVISQRFTPEQLDEHIRIIKERENGNSVFS